MQIVLADCVNAFFPYAFFKLTIVNATAKAKICQTLIVCRDSGFVQQLHSIDPQHGADFSGRFKQFASAKLSGSFTAGN